MTRRDLNIYVARTLLFAASLVVGNAQPENLEKDLTDIADRVFASQTLRLSENSRRSFEKFIDDGVVDMGYGETDPESVTKAKASAAIFAEEMVRNSSDRIIDDKALDKARAKRCPLYPFC